MRCWCLSSSGFTAIPVSASIVSGRVVAIIIDLLSLIGYLIYQIDPSFSICSTSKDWS